MGSLVAMSDRVVNFGSGPATLPLPVLEQVQRDLISLPGIGISPLEISHRSSWFAGVLEEAEGTSARCSAYRRPIASCSAKAARLSSFRWWR